MLSCKEVCELVHNEAIPWWKKVQMKMHFLICKGCQSYVKQMKILKEAFARRSKKLDSTEDEHIRKLIEKIKSKN